MSLAKRFCRMVKATMQAIDPSSAVGIAEGQDFEHDSVYRVLQEENMYFSILAVEQVEKYGGMRGGYLVLDDSFVMRYGSGRMKLKKLKDRARGGYRYGFQIVLLIWTDGKIRLPISFRVFAVQEGEKSKINLALELFADAQAMGLNPSFVLFDAWYGAKQILNWLSKATWLFVTQLRKNRHLDNSPLQERRHPYWVKVGKLNYLHCSVVVVRNRKRYFCSNDTSLKHKRIQRIYRFRQNVEEAFRSLKQELGWTGMRFRTPQTLASHLALTLSAYAVIETERIKLKLSFYKFRRGLISAKHQPPKLFLHDFKATA